MSGWDRFRKQHATEREQLRRLLAGMRPVLDKCGKTVPFEIKLAALERLEKELESLLGGAPPHAPSC